MRIVDMGMIVLECVMGVLVQVTLGEVEPHSDQHEYSPDYEQMRWTLSKPEDGNRRTAEWRHREVGAGSSCPKMPGRQHEQDQTQSVAQEAQHERRPNASRSRPVRSQRNSKAGVNATCDQSLEHRDLNRITGRDLLGEVVVDGPGKTGSRYQQRAREASPGESSFPGDHTSTGDNHQHTERDPAVEVLVKQEPCEQRGKYSLQIEQQRRARGRRPL